MGKQKAEGDKKGKRSKFTIVYRKSGKQKAKGAKKGKRSTVTIEHRKFLCALRKANSNYSDISKAFTDRYGFKQKSSS